MTGRLWTGAAPESMRPERIQERWFWAVSHRVYWHGGRFGGRVHGHGPVVAAMGDSLTDPYVGFTFPWQGWLRRIGQRGYKTVNLGNGSDTTIDMRRRVDEFMMEGRPDVAVLFAGSCDVESGIDPRVTEENITFIVEWLQERGVGKIALIGPGVMNLPKVPDYMPHVQSWDETIEPVRVTLREIAARHGVKFVDLAEFQRERIASGKDPDFTRVPYRQSRSWHACVGDGHLNAYGQGLVAEALVGATADWWAAQPGRRSLRRIARRREHGLTPRSHLATTTATHPGSPTVCCADRHAGD